MKTVSDLINVLHGEEQNANTRCGWVLYEGQHMFIRRHWSYSGGWPAYEDEDCSVPLGEFRSYGEIFPWIVDGEQKTDRSGSKLFDRKIQFHPEQ